MLFRITILIFTYYIFAASSAQAAWIRTSPPKKWQKSSRSSKPSSTTTYCKSKKIISRANKQNASKEQPTLVTQYKNEKYSVTIPGSWQVIEDKQQLPDTLDVLCIASSHEGQLTPSINIATSSTKKTQSEYMEEVLSYHRNDPNTYSSKFFHMIPAKTGSFAILQTETQHPAWGKIFLIQGIQVHNFQAYVFNCSTTFEDYQQTSASLFAMMTSFELLEKEKLSGDSMLENSLQQFRSP